MEIAVVYYIKEGHVNALPTQALTVSQDVLLWQQRGS